MKNILTLFTMIILALFFVACGDKEKDDTCPMECPDGQVSVNIEGTDAEAACKCQDVPKKEAVCDPVCTEGQTCVCTEGDDAKCECKAVESIENICVPECVEGKECKCVEEDGGSVACSCVEKKESTDTDTDKVPMCNPVCTGEQECVCADNEAGDTLCTCNEKKKEETEPTPETDTDKKQDNACSTDADCEKDQKCSCLEDECVCTTEETKSEEAGSNGGDKKDETAVEAETVDPCKDRKAGDACDTDKTCQTDGDNLVCK